jgi:hypothetical protein
MAFMKFPHPPFRLRLVSLANRNYEYASFTFAKKEGDIPFGFDPVA